jgi:hypothetical protein
MSETQITPAPEIPLDVPSGSKWDREYRAFLRMMPGLLATHRGKFVAVHEGQLVQSGDDQIDVALAAYRMYGYLPIFVGQVTDAPIAPLRVASPRLQKVESK